MDMEVNQCCHESGDYGQTPSFSGDPVGVTPVFCNTPSRRMSVPVHQQSGPETSQQGPCGQSSCPGAGKHGQGCYPDRDLHCHTPASPCCRHVVNTPGSTLVEPQYEVHTVSTPDQGHTHASDYHHRRKSSIEVPDDDEVRQDLVSQAPGTAHSYVSNLQATEKEISVHTPHESQEATMVHTPHSAGDAKVHPVTPGQETFPGNNISDKPDEITSRNLVRCSEEQTTGGNVQSVGQQTSRGLELYAQQFKEGTQQENFQVPYKTPSSHKSPSIEPVNLLHQEQTAMNHLSFKEKQLVLSAVGKAASNMSCAAMLQERDKNKTGSVGRRDFQMVMDKAGVLKNISSRELDAIFKGFPAKSETELDYNKFICACRDYNSKESSPRKFTL